jgi:hypothetical protein
VVVVVVVGTAATVVQPPVADLSGGECNGLLTSQLKMPWRSPGSSAVKGSYEPVLHLSFVSPTCQPQCFEERFQVQIPEVANATASQEHTFLNCISSVVLSLSFLITFFPLPYAIAVVTRCCRRFPFYRLRRFRFFFILARGCCWQWGSGMRRRAVTSDLRQLVLFGLEERLLPANGASQSRLRL